MKHLVCLALLAMVVAGCGIMRCRVPSTAHAHQEWMPCSRATGVARDALFAMGYNAEITKPVRAGSPGEVAAQKTGRWTARNPEPGRGDRLLVRIDCSDRGADFEATTDAPFFRRLTFDKQFFAAIDDAAQRALQRPRVHDETARGLLVDVEPQPTASVVDGPTAVANARAVRIKIANRTDRRYRFRRDQVRVVSQEGQRLSALGVAESVGTEASPGSHLDQQLAAETTIEPDGTLEGVLYFPATTYRRATVVLIEVESDEPEGFSVEF
jgi:hypothetical protein